jgi:hypothetical protein
MSKKSSQSNEIDGERNAKGQFQVGHTGMGGRPKGSRNLLGEKFLSDLRQEWEISGVECLKRVARDSPHIFVKVVANLLPAQLEAELNVNVSLFREIENTNQAYQIAMNYLHSKIEAENEPVLIEANNGGE